MNYEHIIIYSVITLVFILFDLITGFASAAFNHEIKSSKMREGLKHKASYILILLLAFLIEFASEFIELGITLPLFLPACVIICGTELVSILENIVKLNPDLAESRLLMLFKSTTDVSSKSDASEDENDNQST